MRPRYRAALSADTAITILLFLLGCAGADRTSTDTAASSGTLPQIPIKVLRPNGNGPFPAIVIMHDCSGLGPRSSGAPERWAQELLEHHYVILMPDSFSTRGFAEGVCTDPSPHRREVSPVRRAVDAYAALAYLRTLSFVDASRVGLMGRFARWVHHISFNGSAESRQRCFP
jgi:dienelactone hydrolase